MAKFNELPFIARFAIFAIVGALVFAAAWYGPVPGFAAMRAANDASMERVKAQQADNARLKPYESQLKEIELQIESLQRQMERQKQIVPDQKTADQFMRDLQQNAQQAGVEIRSYVARPVAQKQYYSEVPFDLEIDGPYFSMLNFFEKVGTSERIINVDNLRMSGIGSKAPSSVRRKYDYAPGETVTVACTARTFFSAQSVAKPAPPTTTPAPGQPPVKKAS
jgi:type IV pilus assembly protein PilO